MILIHENQLKEPRTERVFERSKRPACKKPLTSLEDSLRTRLFEGQGFLTCCPEPEKIIPFRHRGTKVAPAFWLNLKHESRVDPIKKNLATSFFIDGYGIRRREPQY